MFDINEAINAAITKAVNEQLANVQLDLLDRLRLLTERIECLDKATGARLNNAELNLTAIKDIAFRQEVRLGEVEAKTGSGQPGVLYPTSDEFRKEVKSIATSVVEDGIEEALESRYFEIKVREIASDWLGSDEGETRIKDLIDDALSNKEYVENDELEGKLADLLENEITLRVTVER